MGHVWFADCESLFTHVISPNTKQVDNRRLAIDLSALKQLISDNRDDCDEFDGSKGDYPRWIDTSAMLSDCLTKTMTSCRLIETLSTGIFDMRPTGESPAIKDKKKKKVESTEERGGTVARSGHLILLVFVMLVKIARLKHDTICVDIKGLVMPM